MKKLVFIFCFLLSCFFISCNSIQINTNYDNDHNIVKQTTIDEQSVDNNQYSAKNETLNNSMIVTDVRGYNDSDKSVHIEIDFSKELKDDFDSSSYIKVDPNVDYTISKVNSKYILKGNFDAKKQYKISILKGIKAIDNSITLSDTIKNIVFDQKMPKLLFTNSGIILPSNNEKKIYVRSLNVNKMNIIVKKIYSNNLTQFLQNFDFSGNGYYYGFVDNVGDEIYNKNFMIENEVDTWVQSAIDLNGILDANGIYIVEAKFDKDGTSYTFSNNMDEYDIEYYLDTNGKISKTILLTDIGIVAQKNVDGLNINVLDIITNNTISGAKAYLMSRNNQILEEKTTNTNGSVTFSMHKNSFYVLVDNEKSKSILLLNNSLSTNGFDVDGAYVSNGINGYIYTERGVYRPGDTVYTSIIVRNDDVPLENEQPIKITIYDPVGTKFIENDVIKNGKNGFYTYEFKTDTSSRTGIWKIEATVGDQILKKDISVETVVPNNIKVNVNIDDEIQFDDTTNFSIDANYLFGAPASNLKYGINFDIREEPIDFKKYKNYTFKSKTTYGYYDSKYCAGVLDDNGESKIDISFDDVQFGSLNMLMDVEGRVVDDNGRNIVSKKYVKLKKYDTYIGIENTDNYKKPGSNLDLKVICVSNDGEKLVADKKLKYRVYGNDYNWWWDYTDYNDFIRSFKSDKNTILMLEGELVTKNEPVLIVDEVPDAEYLYVEVEDELTGQITGMDLQSSEWIDPSVTKKIETLNITSDKKQYNVGDIAQIKYKATKNSKAIFTIEKKGKILNQYIKDVNNEDMTEEIEITKEMTPNIYVYITLLQDYNTKQNDRPVRLYGIIPISVYDENTKIDLEIDAPEQIKPNEKFTVKIKNKQLKQCDFTIAVVDEGLLDITAFKTPNPFDYFYQKVATNISIFDNYSEIIDRPYGAINQVLKVGGDEALLDELARKRRLKELGLEDAERFVPVSMFKGVLTTDTKGEAKVDFDMPNYMGSVRIMVVASNENSYGSIEKNMIVKAPIIVLPGVPRNLKIKDKLSIPVSIFAVEDNIGNIEAYWNFKNNTQTKNLNLKKGEKQIVYFDETVDNEVGIEEITIGVRSKAYNYEETINIAVNSNNPLVEFTENKEVSNKKSVSFTNNKQFVKGTVDSILTISNKMLLGIDNRLKYLIHYPYGCVEQTTSSVFPQLFLEKLSTNNGLDKSAIITNINAGINRLKLFQLSDGSFSYWPGEKYTSDWATNYVGHFLMYAKNNGYYVPDSMFDNWINYISNKVRIPTINSDYDINWKSYALYLLALSNKQNLSEMNYMYEHHFTNMNNTSKMFLAASYKLCGEEKTAKNIASKINLSNIKKMFDDIYNRDRYYYNSNYGSKLREIAIYLDCYYQIYNKIDKEAFDEILNSLRSDTWYSTQTTSYSLIALSNIVSENIDNEISGTIDIDGVKTNYRTKNKYYLKIDENAKNIKVEPENDGKTYINYYIEGVLVDGEVNDYFDGFKIERNFYNDEGSIIDVDDIDSGKTFWLEVVVKPTDRNIYNVENLALTQILPTGWEIENLRLTNTKMPEWIEAKTSYTITNYTDIRDDRVMWFFNHHTNDEHKFFVKLNSVTKGEFDFPGTTLEAMYDNNYKAFLKGNRVKVN